MEAIIWSRVSSQSQDNNRQVSNLKQAASEKGWKVKRVFEEKVSGTVKSTERKEFSKILDYTEQYGIRLILISEISRIGRKVVDVLNVVDTFHRKGIAIYVQQFNMVSMENGKENPMVMLLLQMMSIGAEMENNLRKNRQAEGIALAKLQQKYTGRAVGSKANRENQLVKYADVVDLIQKSDLSIRRISSITGRSINTVRKVKQLLVA
ncbi:recombinase family protein [Prolixibacteraceae bacterium Z1-6]|uniref:Recombinase family protein n=1 Tax=Draconibacterium aestuarii TaxID=2998507 RepID=A0A9X3F3Q3_9BACT|nr:recombinase family protein [Prolixibacteraceae bacterium Z1-6]